MKKLAVIILILFLLSCTAKIEEPVCKKPYIEWKEGECCLDSNDNLICDWDEQKIVEKVKEEQIKGEEAEIPILDALLAQAPDTYWFHSYDTGKVVVAKDKRHSYVNVEEGITDIYWDTKEKKAVELCNIKEEIAQEGENFQPDRPICNPDFLNIRQLTEPEYKSRFPVGPVDWMKKYKDKKPVLVETSIQTIGVKSISPVLHFQEPDGSFTILKFDYYKKVPVAIDFVKNNIRTKSIKFLFDTDFKLIGIDDPDKAMIPPEETPMPEEPILIILEESELLLSNDIYVKGKVVNQGYDYLEPVRLMIQCFDRQGKMVGSVRTRTFEGVTKHKDTEFKTYVPVKTRDFDYCTAKIR